MPVTYDRAPARAVSNDINTTEDMLALGLESAHGRDLRRHRRRPGQDTRCPPRTWPASARYATSPSNYFTREELIGLHPDFLFAGWNYGLQTGTSLTPPGLAQFGIKTLVLTESCVHVQKSITRSASPTPTRT